MAPDYSVEVCRDVLQREDVLAGMIGGMQTFGELVHFHPTHPSDCHRRRGMCVKPRQEGLAENKAKPVIAFESRASGHIIIDRSALTAQRSADGGPRAGSVSTWARLIRRVFEVVPLACPQCGGAMKVVSFIERRQQDHQGAARSQSKTAIPFVSHVMKS